MSVSREFHVIVIDCGGARPYDFYITFIPLAGE